MKKLLLPLLLTWAAGCEDNEHPFGDSWATSCTAEGMPTLDVSFRRQGLTARPAAVDTLPEAAWVPSAGALAEVPVIWREWVALVWYRLRYF